MQQSNTKGIILVLISAVAMTAVGILVKVAVAHTSVSVLMFGRFFISLLCVLSLTGIHKLKRQQTYLKSKKIHWQILRSIFGCSAVWCLFYSLKLIPLVDVMLLSITFPLFIPVITYLVSGIKTSTKICFGIAAGFLAVLIILGVHRMEINIASVLALSAGLLTACSMVTVCKLSRYEHAETTMFYYYLFGTIFSFLFMLFKFHIPDLHTVGLVLLIGITGAIYQICFTYALHMASARTVTPIMFSSVIFSGIAGWVFWGHVPTHDFYIGMVIIIVSAIFVIYNAKDNKT